MKKFLAPVIIFAFILFIWYLLNLSEISEMNEVHKISHQKSVGFELSELQNNKLENYIKDMYEIKLRGCSIGARIISLKCGFTDSVSKYALGKYDDHVNSEVFKETHKQFEFKPYYIKK